MSIVFTLVFASTSLAKGKTLPSSEEEQVKEMAAQLEFLWEEATIKDEEGNIIDIDFNKLESEFGKSADLTQFKEIYTNSPVVFTKPGNKKNFLTEPAVTPYFSLVTTYSTSKNDAHNRCVNSKLKTYFNGTFFGISALALLYEYLWSGNYTAAAKQLIKMGVKSNIYVITGQLAWIVGQCAYEVDQGKWR